MDSTTNIRPSEPMDKKKSLQASIDEANIAANLDDDELNEIGAECKAGFEADLQSRSHWEEDLDEWTKLAMQVRETKSTPWSNASNVKYPLLSTAAMQFNARAYPSLVPADGKIVKGKTIGKDPTGEKGMKADRVATYMSYQFMHEMDGWDEDMDRLLIMLPIVGTVFKKTYWSGGVKSIASELVLPKNLIVNNWASNLEQAERVSEVIEMSQRVFEERKRQGLFLDVDLGTPTNETPNNTSRDAPARIDETTPYFLIEQHGYLDLDDDGYKEPYIITFHKTTGKVVRITARFEPDGIELDDKGEITKITAIQYYTKYSFVPNPDGSFYDLGFGVLLGPINETVNTLINQLVDAGTLSNLQSGFIGKGLRLKIGDEKFKPGEWKPVASGGSDLKNQIIPLPTKEPSDVLFKLMGAMITSGKELASVAEIFVGKMPGQNTPATTTMATIEQGMKVFTAVYKRIYRALDKEFKKVYKLNGVYLNPETYVKVLDTQVGPADFDSSDYDVCPGADPTAMSSTERLMKAQGLMEMLPNFGPMMNPVEVLKRVLQAQEQPNWESIVAPEVMASGQPPPPPPDPKMMAVQEKAKTDQAKVMMDQQNMQFKQALEQRDQQFKMAMEAAKQHQEAQHAQVMAAIEAQSKATQAHLQVASVAQKVQASNVEHNQKIQQNAESHQQKLSQQRAQSLSQKPTSKTGKATK
jgi:chaperonin GroES